MNLPQATWETIDPQMARDLLATSPGNRSLRLDRVSRQASDMKNGRFLENGETIKIDAAGNLRDGHHRLHAIIQSGVTIRTLVVRGVSDEALRTVDSGSSRTPGDRLQMAGYKNTNTLAAALAWQARYERADFYRLAWKAKVRFFGEDVLVAVERHPRMQHAADKAVSLRTAGRLLTPAFLAFCIYNTPKSMEFWLFLDTGAGPLAVTQKSAPVLLRERLNAVQQSKVRLLDDERAALVIKAHNAWRHGRQMAALRWRREGDSPELFPRWEP
jgi:hypothetical protein